MHVIAYRPLRDYGIAYPDAKGPLDAWYKVARKEAWNNLAEVKQIYPSADYVGGLTVFNIGGNKYRLIVNINYKSQTIFIKGIYTHTEYDKDSWKT